MGVEEGGERRGKEGRGRKGRTKEGGKRKERAGRGKREGDGPPNADSWIRPCGLLLTVEVPAKQVCSPVGDRCVQIMNDVCQQ